MTMRCRLRQILPIFPKSISDIQYIYIRRPVSISDVRYIFQTSDIPALALAQFLSEVRYCILDVGYRYRMSDIDIGCRIRYPDVRYPDVGYRYPDVRCRYPDVGYTYPHVGYRYPDVCYNIRLPIPILDVVYDIICVAPVLF